MSMKSGEVRKKIPEPNSMIDKIRKATSFASQALNRALTNISLSVVSNSGLILTSQACMPNIISFSFHYDRKSYMQLIFRQYYKGIFIRMVTVGGILSLLLTILYLIGINPLQFKVFPFFGLLYGLLTFVIPLLLWWRTKKHFKAPTFLNRQFRVCLRMTCSP